MASKGRIVDDLLVSLAEDIETGEKMAALGRALGFKPAAINRYTETNRIEGRVTCKGTRDMLFDWRQTVGPRDQQCKLKEALKEAKLIMLSQDYLKDTLNIQDIGSKMVSESMSVLQCREKLENMYIDNLCKIQMKPWDPNDYAELKDMHTRVTMVTKDVHGRDTVKKEILHGSVTEIFSRKVNNRLPDRILISAAAGRGKTTAVAKMAYDWANKIQGSGLEELPLLFVLKLRKTGQYTLGEAIKSQLLSDVEDVTPEGLEDFIRKNQDICHIIFDGLDEYAGITSGSNIVKIMRWEYYRECRVLVTTRPHLNYFFNDGDLPRKYTKMVIEGFSRENSGDYIDKFFALISDVSKGERLKVYLNSHPLINELVITPLFCLMICHLWSDEKLTDDISTQTGLLDSVNVFLMHHANARANQRFIITTERLREMLSKLGQVALDGLLHDAKKLVFKPHDFRKIPTIFACACELGIISQSHSVTSACIPQSHETSTTTIEFYHKLAQEHCAAKHIAAVIDGYWLPWMRLNLSKLDRVLRQIKAHIGDYENILRFTAGTGNESCIKILEAILTNKSLDDSERYRILLDCSSETTSVTEGRVSFLVQRCVSAQTIVLKSPTVYTVVGMQNLPQQLKSQVGEVTFEGSVLTADVTKGLWSCLGSFTNLRHLTISDSSFSFPSSLHVLPYVTKLTAERVTSHSYEGLLSSLPGLKEIDIGIDDADKDITQITAGLQRTGREQLTKFRLHSLPSQGKRIGCGTVEYYNTSIKGFGLEIKDCLLSAEMTDSSWSCFRSFTTLFYLTISDSSLSFPSSPPELPYITELTAERVTSHSYEGLLSSLPGLKVIDIIIDDVERDITQITAGLKRTSREQLTDIKLTALLSRFKMMVPRETMRGLGLLIREQTKNLQKLHVDGVTCRDEEGLIDLIECCRHVKTMKKVVLDWCGTKAGGRLDSYLQARNTYYTSGGKITVTVYHEHHPRRYIENHISHAV